MPEKKPNVLTQFLYAFRQKKPPTDDIVAMADKIIEEYIYTKKPNDTVTLNVSRGKISKEISIVLGKR